MDGVLQPAVRFDGVVVHDPFAASHASASEGARIGSHDKTVQILMAPASENTDALRALTAFLAQIPFDVPLEARP
jgi:hypothetical protein